MIIADVTLFYDIEFLLLEPWWESKKPPKPIVAQRTLYDIRDNNSYTIRKLADGNCWMTQNLKYKLEANKSYVGINHNTNETFTFNTGATCATDGDCIMNGNTAMTEQVTNGGYYYSWYAATAGTGTASMASGDATGSICPKGWRLPANYTSDSNKSYSSITQKYLYSREFIPGDHVVTMEGLPLQFSRAGFYYNGTIQNYDIFGSYWSSSSRVTDTGYGLGYDTSFTFAQYSHNKHRGFSVRCVVQ